MTLIAEKDLAMTDSQPYLSLTLMRHGRSLADDEGVHEGRYDSPLTEVGRQQVTERAQSWLSQGVTFDYIIASTLQRADASARIVGEILQVPVENDPGWMEFNTGPLAGLPYAEARQRYPQPAYRSPYEPYWGTGESEIEFAARVALAVERLVRRGSGAYLVVSHGGALNVALRHIVGAQPPVSGMGVWFHFGDTGFARLTYRLDQHVWVLRELNPGLDT
jgi:2,3-bisphosphoglycerate-dependent phosphoglycerate mutase